MLAECCHLCITLTFCMHCVQDAAGNVNWGFIIFSLLCLACGAVWLRLPITPRVHLVWTQSVATSVLTLCCHMQDAAGNVNWGFIIFSLLCLACGAVWLRLLHAWCALGRNCLSCPRAQRQVTLPGSPLQCLTRLSTSTGFGGHFPAHLISV